MYGHPSHFVRIIQNPDEHGLMTVLQYSMFHKVFCLCGFSTRQITRRYTVPMAIQSQRLPIADCRDHPTIHRGIIKRGKPSTKAPTSWVVNPGNGSIHHTSWWLDSQTNLSVADWCSITTSNCQRVSTAPSTLTTSPHLKEWLGHLKPSKSWQAWNNLSALRKLMGTYEVQTS